MNSNYLQGIRINANLAKFSIFFLIIAILVGTFLRLSLIIISPLIIVAVCVQLKLRLTASLALIFSLILLSFSLSFFNGNYLNYKLLSLFNMIPFVLLLFSRPRKDVFFQKELTPQLFKCLTLVGVINNLIGFMQISGNTIGDDSFVGIYSTFSVSLNGLVIFNAILFFYYFCLFLARKTARTMFWCLFFLTSFVMGFYGAGLFIFAISFVLVFYQPRLKDIIKTGLISFVSLIIIYFLLLYLKPNVLDYNIRNLKKLASFDIQNGPRKIISFYNYGISYPGNVKDFLFGSGPGTFNSRSAFIVGSPTFFTSATFLKSDEKPYYFANYAYTLWNPTNTSSQFYLDGFRNQPFSSILAFLGEYGLIFTLIFFLCYFYHWQQVLSSEPKKMFKLSTVYKRVYKFLAIFLILLLFIDNFFEYPEIVILVLIVMKTLEIDLKNFSSPDHITVT